jgi:hypothetical protein
MMADFEATGDELQKLVRLGKKRPMPFAFCPSAGGDDESLFATHRTKQPEVIAKAARKASGQTKVCFGTFTLEGKLMTLVLAKELPSIAKKLKKHLRQERLSLNVRVVDLMGNELDSDIEELPEDPTLEDDAPDIDDTPDEAVQPLETPEGAVEENLPDSKELARQLKELQPGIMALQGGVGDTLRTALAGAVGLLKSGQLVRAEATIAAMARALSNQPAAPQTATAEANADATAAAQRLKGMRDRAGTIIGPAGEKLVAALGLAAQHIKAGDTPKASQTMDAVEQAMARLQPAATPLNTDAARKWADLAARLEPVVLATIKTGKGDTDAIKRKFFFMQDQAAAGDPSAAIAAAPALAEMIKVAQSATQTQAEDAIPANVVPFVTSRLAWVKTRSHLRDEITKLKTAMDATLSKVPGLEEAIGETGKLFSYLDALDDRLETTLEALVVTPDGPARESLKAKARQVIAEYNSTLDNAFFRDVDGDNGFAPVTVRAPAIAALAQVSDALAA